MKKILKFVITIAIIVAIFFGIKALAGNSGSNNGTYTYFASAENSKSLKKSQIEKELTEVFDYITSGEHAGSISDEVKQSLESGELYNYRLFVEQYEILSTDYINATALSVENSSNLQAETINAHKDFITSLNKLYSSSKILGNHIKKVAMPNVNDFESYFNDIVADYKIVVEKYSVLCIKLNNLVKKDVYNGSMMSYNLTLDELETKMLSFALNNNAIMEDAKTMTQNIVALKSNQTNEKFVLALSQVKDIDSLLKAEDKTSFVNSSQDENLQLVAQVLFNISKGE